MYGILCAPRGAHNCKLSHFTTFDGKMHYKFVTAQENFSAALALSGCILYNRDDIRKNKENVL